MSIEEHPATRYVPKCENCEWVGGSSYRRSLAEAKMREHECGVHRQEYDHTGGHRGILGGWNVHCVCGAHYVTDDASKPFKCPRDTTGDDLRDDNEAASQTLGVFVSEETR